MLRTLGRSSRRAIDLTMHGSPRLISGEKIRKLREAAGLTVTQLAGAAGCTEGYLRGIEKNRNRNPSLKIVDGLLRALDCELTDILE